MAILGPDGRPYRPPMGEAAGISTDDAYWLAGYGRTCLPTLDPLESSCPERFETIWDLYDEMLRRDPHLKALYSKLKRKVLGCPWDILPGGDLLRDAKLAAWAKQKLLGLRNLRQDRWELLDSVPKGFAVSEVMWRRDGEEVVPAELRSRRQRRFGFDKEANLRLKKDATDQEGVALPERKFLVHRSETEYENPYGHASLGDVFWPYWFKKKGVQLWALLCEKRVFPTPMGHYSRGNPGDRDKLIEIFRTLQAETGIALPEGVAIDFLEMKGSLAVTCYKEFIALLDDWESERVLGQTLTTREGKSGTRAQAEVHERGEDDLVAAHAEDLDTTMNQLLEWMVDLNYAAVDTYPRFVTQVEPKRDGKENAERDKILARDIGVPVAESYFYDKYGLKKPTEEDPALALPPPALPPGAPAMAAEGDALSFGDLAGDDDADALYRDVTAKSNRLLALVARSAAARARKNASGPTPT